LELSSGQNIMSYFSWVIKYRWQSYSTFLRQIYTLTGVTSHTWYYTFESQWSSTPENVKRRSNGKNFSCHSSIFTMTFLMCELNNYKVSWMSFLLFNQKCYRMINITWSGLNPCSSTFRNICFLESKKELYFLQ